MVKQTKEHKIDKKNKSKGVSKVPKENPNTDNFGRKIPLFIITYIVLLYLEIFYKISIFGFSHLLK